MEQCEGVATGGGIQRTCLFFGHDMQGIGAQPSTEPVPPAVETTGPPFKLTGDQMKLLPTPAPFVGF